jgi:beta-galactosidase
MLSLELIAVMAFMLTVCLVVTNVSGNTSEDAQLPQGVKAVWDMSKAYNESTSTRERICINGLWRWQPAHEFTDQVPTDGWGYFKVPGAWLGINSYIQKDCQIVYTHPDWSKENLSRINSAWYQREIIIPDNWSGRKIKICADYINSYAIVYIDGAKVGEMRFPSGELDITANCQSGAKHLLSLYVVAMPLKEVMQSFGDTNAVKQVKGEVSRRGLCGDVFLSSTPVGASIENVKVDTSVQKWEITFNTALRDLVSGKKYTLLAQIMDNGRKITEFKSATITDSDLKNGLFSFTCQWKPEKLWDTNTPQNKYDLQIALLDDKDKSLDISSPVRFGFREFWIDGRDFYLNGTRIFCFVVPLDNPVLGAAWANYEGAMESLKRLKTFGVNLVYTHNYGCEPGTHLSFDETLRAADDAGMLVSFSQPHFGQYEWATPDADKSNGYAKHAEFYVRVAQNHPSVVMYSMSHNSLGYGEDQNPDFIDGIHGPTEPWAENNRKLAGRAEAIVRQFDSSRIIYHHSSGNFGSMHTLNCYLDFVPIQERSDWFEHWSRDGVKPLFLCEYGDPWGINWTTYRGWYNNERAFGSARVPWEFCMAEWNSQFLGDKCYQLSEMEKANLRFESKQWRDGKTWFRWDYPSDPVSFRSQDRETVWAMHITDNWKAFRTWEISAFNSWSYTNFWNLREGVDKSRKNLKVDWENLQRPGFSPDYIEGRYERFDLSFERDDWTPNSAGKALIRNNQPLLAYIGGKPAKFTSKDHNFQPGDTVEKQIIIINNSRQTITCDCSWKLNISQALEGNKKITIQTGQQTHIPLKLALPNTLKPGEYSLSMTAKFSSGEIQEDSFIINILPKPQSLRNGIEIGLFDPKGETSKLLSDMGIQFKAVDHNSDLTQFNMLIIGKEALTLDGLAPNITNVRDGLKVIMFEQKPEVLEKRFGFRIQEYGLRQVFKRVPDHPILAGLENENLRNWCGESTIVPPRLTYELRPKYGPTIKWCDIEAARAWRCGNYGNTATVLIEKPTCGNFLPIIDGGFNLQYSPLMEYHEGKGIILLCQMDVTGRTEIEPSAMLLVSNMLKYISTWSHKPNRKTIYVGEPAGKEHLQQIGISVSEYSGEFSNDSILVVGPNADQNPNIKDWINSGGHLLAIGLDETDAQALMPVSMKKAEYICAYFKPMSFNSMLAGIGSADATLREPREISLISSGAEIVGDGILATAKDNKAIFCQLVPWQFDYKKYYNLKKSYLRTSFLLTRILGNMGASYTTPFLYRFSTPFAGKDEENRWLKGFYLDTPEEMDDPYRYFRW